MTKKNIFVNKQKNYKVGFALPWKKVVTTTYNLMFNASHFPNNCIIFSNLKKVVTGQKMIFFYSIQIISDNGSESVQLKGFSSSTK